MKFYTPLVIFVMFLVSCNSGNDIPENSDNEAHATPVYGPNFSLTAIGEIADKYEIVMDIRCVDGMVRGAYRYTKHNTPILLSGSFDVAKGLLYLEEFETIEHLEASKKSGIFELRLAKGEPLSGQWQAVKNGKPQPKNLDVTLHVSYEGPNWYDLSGPFHPWYVRKLLRFEEGLSVVDLSQPVDVSDLTFNNGYPLAFEILSESSVKSSFFSYEFIGMNGNKYLVEVNRNAESGFFSAIWELSCDDNQLRRERGIAEGLSCNGGVRYSKIEKGKLYYSVNMDFGKAFMFGAPSGFDYYIDMNIGELDCAGKYEMTYDMETGSFDKSDYWLNDYPYDTTAVVSKEQQLFSVLLEEYRVNKGTRISQEDLNRIVEQVIQQAEVRRDEKGGC